MQLNLENVLYVEDRLSSINDLLKAILPSSASVIENQNTSMGIIELCEDWWEILRQETVLFDVYVSQSFLIELLQKIFKDEST